MMAETIEERIERCPLCSREMVFQTEPGDEEKGIHEYEVCTTCRKHVCDRCAVYPKDGEEPYCPECFKDEELLAAEEGGSEGIAFLQAEIGVMEESIAEKRKEIKEAADEFFKERGVKIDFIVNESGYLERVPEVPEESDEYEIVVDLQSFVMGMPKKVDPDDNDTLRQLVIAKIKEKIRDEEIYLDQYSVEKK